MKELKTTKTSTEQCQESHMLLNMTYSMFCIEWSVNYKTALVMAGNRTQQTVQEMSSIKKCS